MASGFLKPGALIDMRGAPAASEGSSCRVVGPLDLVEARFIAGPDVEDQLSHGAAAILAGIQAERAIELAGEGPNDTEAEAVASFRIDLRWHAATVVGDEQTHQSGRGTVEQDGNGANTGFTEAMLKRIADQFVGDHDDRYGLFGLPLEGRIDLDPASDTDRTMGADQACREVVQHRVQVDCPAAGAVEALMHLGKQVHPSPGVLERCLGRSARRSAASEAATDR